MRTVKKLLILALALFLAACAGMPGTTEPLKVSLADIALIDAGLIEQRLALKLRVQNPNRFDIPINGLSYELELNDKPFAQGVSQPHTTIPAYGESLIETEATSNLGGILRQLEVLQKDQRLRYRLQGKADLGGIRGAQPFDMEGEIALPGFKQ